MEKTNHATSNDRRTEGLVDRVWPKTEKQVSVWVLSKSILNDVGL